MKIQHNENGFVLVTGLLILIVLTMIGIAAVRNTSLELQIAGNDRLHTETFYAAEAGAILGTEVLEQNFNCATGFDKDDTTTNPGVNEPSGRDYAIMDGQVRVYDKYNKIAIWRNGDPDALEPSDAVRILAGTDNIVGMIEYADVAYPADNIPTGEDVGYIYMGGYTEMMPGGALQMAAGYEGKGKGSAVGGVAKIIDIFSQYQGPLNSEAIVLFGWRHLIGSEGDCVY